MDGGQAGGGGLEKYPPIHQETAVGPSGSEPITRTKEQQFDIGLFLSHIQTGEYLSNLNGSKLHLAKKSLR
jgi:hypothetical protein